MKLPLPQNQFVRQVLGAALGAVIAFALYGAYGVVMPRLAAMLPQGGTSQDEESERDRAERQDSIVLRARQELGARE